MPRRLRMLTYQGETKTMTEWAAAVGVDRRTFNSRLRAWGTAHAIEMGVAQVGAAQAARIRRNGATGPLPGRTKPEDWGVLVDEPDEWDAPHCPRCGLRGEHECLRGDATAGLGQWRGSTWGAL